MEPLRIDIHLSTPMIKHERLLHFDALLANLAAEAGRSNGVPWEKAIQELPLEKEKREGGNWVWKASAFKATSIYQNMRAMVRRTSVEDIERDRNIESVLKMKEIKINLRSGHDRNYFWYIGLSTVPLAQAWCIGDKERIIELMSGLNTIGKLKRNGHGRVDRVDVVSDKDANDLWVNRVMPWEIPGSVPIIAASQAPYFAPANQKVCYARPEIYS